MIEKRTNIQKGATLITSLILLLLLSILAFTSIQNAVLQEKMSANYQDKQLSFHAASKAINEAETVLSNLTSPPPPTPTNTCSASPCILSLNVSKNPEKEDSSFWDTYGTEISGENLYKANIKPKYIIQFLQFVPDSLNMSYSNGIYFYRVSARGTGTSINTNTILQTTLALRL